MLDSEGRNICVAKFYTDVLPSTAVNRDTDATAQVNVMRTVESMFAGPYDKKAHCVVSMISGAACGVSGHDASDGIHHVRICSHANNYFTAMTITSAESWLG
jgi:hypothetical protein